MSKEFKKLQNKILVHWKTIADTYIRPESTKQMEEKLNFQVPAEGLELVIWLRTQY